MSLREKRYNCEGISIIWRSQKHVYNSKISSQNLKNNSKKFQWPVYTSDFRPICRPTPWLATTADSNPTPETTSRRLSAEVQHVPMFAKKWHRYLRGSHSVPSRWTCSDLSSCLSPQQRLSVPRQPISRSLEDAPSLSQPSLTERRSSKHIVNLSGVDGSQVDGRHMGPTNRSCKHGLRAINLEHFPKKF